jgi:hypothetical protein
MTTMNRLLPLVQREWLQHRFGWAMLVLVPFGLGVLLASLGQIDFGDQPPSGEMLPLAITAISLLASSAAIFVILWGASMIFASGLARRDHGDRSVEFWLSLPVSHTASLAVPLVVHLLVVPAAALVIGLAGGVLMSLLLVTRLVDFGAWLALPWGDAAPAVLALLGRLAAGIPLATLWLLPLLLLLVLLNAWFKRWGLVVMVAGVVVLVILERTTGLGLASLVAHFASHAASSFIGASHTELKVSGADEALKILDLVPGWAGNDLLAALRDLASPLLAGGLLASAGLFALLIDWRRRGASAGS